MGTFGGTPQKADLAREVATATLGALNAATAGVLMHGLLNLTVLVPSAFVGTVLAERSFDGGATWAPLWTDAYGVQLTFAAAGTVTVLEAEAGVLWRLRCSAYTSGSATARVSQ